MRYLLVALALSIASPAPAQIRFFKDGSILVIGPTKQEQRRRRAGMMLGVMSNRQLPSAAANSAASSPLYGQQPPQPTGMDGH